MPARLSGAAIKAQIIASEKNLVIKKSGLVLLNVHGKDSIVDRLARGFKNRISVELGISPFKVEYATMMSIGRNMNSRRVINY